MPNPNIKLIELWEYNKTQLTEAILRAGGSTGIITPVGVRDFLITLASNNIRLDATYEKPQINLASNEL